jgi:hypothetical protein
MVKRIKMSYHLRQASTEDIPFMIHLEKVVFAQFPEVMEHWDEQHQKEHYEHCFRPKYVSIIESEDHPIGAISIISRRKDISIVYLYLLPEFQERDVDFSLIKEVLRKAKKEQKPVFTCMFRSEKRARMLLCSHLGFEIFSEDELRLRARWDPN